MSMVLEIARFLTTNGLGVFDDVNGTSNPLHNIFIGIMPDGEHAPNNLILLNQYAGRSPVLKALDDVQRPSLQVKCRAEYYEDASGLAEQINELLDQFSGVIESGYYNWIRAVQAPFFLEQDTNERTIFVQNFLTDRGIN